MLLIGVVPVVVVSLMGSSREGLLLVGGDVVRGLKFKFQPLTTTVGINCLKVNYIPGTLSS